MSEEETQKLEARLATVIETTIQAKVNGKIDAMKVMMQEHNDKHESDMKELKPALELISGGKIAGRILSWTAGIAVGYAAIRGFIVK